MQEAGHIVNIISTAGLKITPMMGIYAGTKMLFVPLRKLFVRNQTEKYALREYRRVCKTDFAGSIKNEEMRTAIQKKWIKWP